MRAALLALAATGLIAASAPLHPADLAGAYHRHVSGAFANGREYGAEDVLEVVPTSPTAAYVRTRLNFGNGHLCEMAGVFDAVGPELVYRDPNRVEGEARLLGRRGLPALRAPADQLHAAPPGLRTVPGRPRRARRRAAEALSRHPAPYRARTSLRNACWLSGRL